MDAVQNVGKHAASGGMDAMKEMWFTGMERYERKDSRYSAFSARDAIIHMPYFHTM